MIAEWGSLALVLSFCLALVQGTLPWLGAKRQRDSWMSLARPCALGQFFLISISFLCLLAVFIGNDFSVAYVAMNSAASLPLIYRIGAVWGGHEGSLLLWMWMINAWSFALVIWSRSLPKDWVAYLFTALAWLNVGFLWFLLATSNPFARLFVNTPIDGNDLNPVLQDPGLLLHPPMLYMGYVGFAIVFAFAIAGLLRGEIDRQWASWARPWAIAAWLSLTLGIVLGSWWAYHELGWGGWWFWDPVENASLLPWLTGTALLHCLLATESRGVFKSWTILLALLTFALSLVGTFLVRSGVLISVHSFASDPGRGAFLLKYLFFVLVVSCLLYAWRAPRLTNEGRFQWLSRESFLLSNNVLLLVMMITIMLGTLYPLLLEVLGLGKISVGVPYFNAVFVPLAMPLFFLMAIGPLCYWQQMAGKALLQRLWLVFVVSLALGVLLPWLLTAKTNGMVMLGVFFACWVALSTFSYLWRIYRLRKAWHRIDLNQYAMVVAHLGVAMAIMGVTVVSQYSAERDVRIAPGESVSVGGYDFYFMGTRSITGDNYTGTQIDFAVSRGTFPIAEVSGEQRVYTVSRMPIIESGIYPGLWRDLYVAVGEPFRDGSWAVRIYYKPFVRWIWLGGLCMMLGGVLAAWAKRKPQRRVEA